MRRLLCALCALTWWVLPGMGLIDLSVSWSSAWPVMLEAGWGLFFTIGLGLPFAATACVPRLARAALVQLYVVTAALLVGVIVGLEPQSYWIFVLLAIELPLLHVMARDSALGDRSLARVLLALAVAAAPAALVYAWEMAADNRRSLITSDITNYTDHFSVQAALGLALIALPAVAAFWPSTRRLLGTSTALMGGYLGIVSLGWPHATAGFSVGWSIATVVWAAAVLLASWTTSSGVQPRREQRAPEAAR